MAGTALKVGDYVGLIDNIWMEKNPHFIGTDIATELFEYEEAKPLGLITTISLYRKHVIVLCDDGHQHAFPAEMLVLMSEHEDRN